MTNNGFLRLLLFWLLVLCVWENQYQHQHSGPGKNHAVDTKRGTKGRHFDSSSAVAASFADEIPSGWPGGDIRQLAEAGGPLWGTLQIHHLVKRRNSLNTMQIPRTRRRTEEEEEDGEDER